MSLKLYEIVQEMERFEELYDSLINEETGEIESSDTLQILEDEMIEILTKKSEGIVKYIVNVEAEIKAIKAEEERQKKRRVAFEKKLENFKKYVMINMLKMNTSKIETTFGNINLRKSKQVIVNENICAHDERYWTQEVTDKFDKKKLKELIEKGESIAGVIVVENATVSVK